MAHAPWSGGQGKPFLSEAKRVARHPVNRILATRWRTEIGNLQDSIRNPFVSQGRDLESAAANRLPGVTILVLCAAEPESPK